MRAHRRDPRKLLDHIQLRDVGIHQAVGAGKDTRSLVCCAGTTGNEAKELKAAMDRSGRGDLMIMERTIQIVTHEEARRVDIANWAAMTREERWPWAQSFTPFGYGTIILMLTDRIELCRLFSTHGVDFLLVGGQAVIAHGYPRLTRDMDLWVRPTAENGEKILAALNEFGVAPPEFEAERFEDRATMLMLGQERSKQWTRCSQHIDPVAVPALRSPATTQRADTD